MTSDAPKKWTHYLALAKWWYNTNFHVSAHKTPFEILYGYPTPIHLPYIPEDSRNATVDHMLRTREEGIKVLRFHLRRAQNRMKQNADRKRSDREFAIRDYVLVKLQPYRQNSLKTETS